MIAASGITPKFWVTFFVTLLLIIYTIYNISEFNRRISKSVLRRKSDINNYIIYTNSCRIYDYQPFNEDSIKYFDKRLYTSCRGTNLLSTIVLNEKKTEAYLRIKYSKLKCCYSYIYRGSPNLTHLEDTISYSECEEIIGNEVQIKPNLPIYVLCDTSILLNFFEKVYENVHFPLLKTEETIKKTQRFKSTKRPISVLVLGIDSVSRLNFKRTLSYTNDFLNNEPNWFEFNVYHKVNLNTFPNLCALLLGSNVDNVWANCNPRHISGLDNCTFAWNLFNRYDYVTGFFEDTAEMSTFNLDKKGFNQMPTDYYGRSYFLATHNLSDYMMLDGLPYCTGPEVEGERVWDKALEFVNVHKGAPYFGFFWMNSYSHNDQNTISGMDLRIRNYLENITRTVENDTIVFLLSDHGIRFGEFRKTLSGFIEDSLPFLKVFIPDWFQKEYNKEFAHFLNNRNKLLTPYDIFMTFQNILNLSGVDYEMEKSIGCPDCKSIFEYIDDNRSCEDAGILHEYCTCYNYQKRDQNDLVAQSAANAIIDYINSKVIAQNDLCYQYSLGKILTNYVMMNNSDESYDKTKFALVSIETVPKAIFEGFVDFSFTQNSENNSIILSKVTKTNRLDAYSITSKCIDIGSLKEYCLCKN